MDNEHNPLFNYVLRFHDGERRLDVHESATLRDLGIQRVHFNIAQWQIIYAGDKLMHSIPVESDHHFDVESPLILTSDVLFLAELFDESITDHSTFFSQLTICNVHSVHLDLNTGLRTFVDRNGTVIIIDDISSKEAQQN